LEAKNCNRISRIGEILIELEIPWQALLAPYLGSSAPLEERVQVQLNQYLTTLLQWNARMNLTAIREPAEIIRRHFGESLFAAKYLAKSLKTLLDVGTGAGFPGLPIQIQRPEIDVTLAESNAKKVSFLREITRKNALKTTIFAGRVENMGADMEFSVVTLRAVERMQEVLPVAARHVEAGGNLLVMTTTNDVAMLSATVNDFERGFEWQEPVLIPESESRVVLIGQRMQL
jgi:16S rRNA (guanine527-N7)-methyltransferase